MKYRKGRGGHIYDKRKIRSPGNLAAFLEKTKLPENLAKIDTCTVNYCTNLGTHQAAIIRSPITGEEIITRMYLCKKHCTRADLHKIARQALINQEITKIDRKHCLICNLQNIRTEHLEDITNNAEFWHLCEEHEHHSITNTILTETLKRRQ